MKRIFIDPSYPAYENNKLFDESDLVLNRDNTLRPFVKLKQDLAQMSIELMTYDQVEKFSPQDLEGDGYISLGIIRNVLDLQKRKLRFLAFYLMEPPIVIPKLYASLPYLTSHFEKVFIHNITGDCYSLKNVNQAKLVKMYLPQPFGDVVEKYWANKNRVLGIVAIIGNHKPQRLLKKELYSERIKWAVGLSKYIEVDLFGNGWSRLLSRSALWTVYLKNYFKIKKIYKGSCKSKLETMSNYDYALCFENLMMDGYLTEKIFDCFYSGVIPIYRGGDDVVTRIPPDCFIDIRNFKNCFELSQYLLRLSDSEKNAYRLSAKKFLLSVEGQKYFNFIDTLELST